MLKRFLVFSFLCFVLNGYSNAIVQIKSTHSDYLKYESININVKIKDDSYMPLVIGDVPGFETDANVTFQLFGESEKYLPLKPITQKSFVKTLLVQPSKIGSFNFDLTEHYDINEIGTYKLKAIVSFGQKVFESEVISFEVFNGMEITSVEKLVSGYMDKTRDYSLRYMAREGKEVLFLRVDEIERSLNYGVIPLGNFVRVFPPQIMVDLEGFVKIRYQAGYNCFCICYFVSDEAGLEYVDRRYVTRDGNPYNFKLSANEQGKPVPTGSSEIKPPEKRSLWDRMTGQGKPKTQEEEVKDNE
jgi:hypothetical protein